MFVCDPRFLKAFSLAFLFLACVVSVLRDEFFENRLESLQEWEFFLLPFFTARLF